MKPTRQARQSAVSYLIAAGAGDQHVPRVRLSGLWLEQLGFAIGTKLGITASAGQLLMEVLPPVEMPAKVRGVRR
ncbi:type I toxin-antitoxin system SymE family toxin [Xanthomonas axonopodis pv. passiflorae]|nr:type I toxin-antitoxin system SymE family toxin [Xanthomonas campestris pv. passiflorae]